VEYEGAVYHVTVRSNAGGDLIVDDGDRTYWICPSGPELGVVGRLPGPSLQRLV
jgi:hypothetical protein